MSKMFTLLYEIPLKRTKKFLTVTRKSMKYQQIAYQLARVENLKIDLVVNY